MESPAYRTRSANDQVVRKVVEAVSEAEGVDPVDLSPPLYDAVDADAMSKLLQSAPRTSISFRYRQWRVEVGGDGTVELAAVENGE